MTRRRIKLSSPMRRRRLIGLCGYVLVLVLAFVFGLDHFGQNSRSRNDWNAFDHQTFLVSRVVDGDTIRITPVSGGDETVVRLIGLDAPETHDPVTDRPAHWSSESAAYLREAADGKPVILRLEPVETRDKYDRLLTYVYLSDSDCVNINLIRDGQAYADRRFRHSYRPQYEQAENEARTKQRGLWKGLIEDQMPAWRRVWLHSRTQEE